MVAFLPFAALLALLMVRAIQFGLSNSKGQLLTDPDMRRRGGTVILPQGVRQWLVWAAEPIVSLLVRARFSANQLTGLSLGFAVLAGILLWQGQSLLGGQCILFGALLDYFDGRVARVTGTSGRAGAFLDSVVDRIGEAAVLLGALGAISDSGVGICGTFVLLASSNLISYCRAKSEQLGGDLSGGLMQRGERAVILALGAILDHAYPGTLHQWLDLGPILGAKHPFLGAAICFAATLSFITAAGRVLRGYRELASKKEHE